MSKNPKLLLVTELIFCKNPVGFLSREPDKNTSSLQSFKHVVLYLVSLLFFFSFYVQTVLVIISFRICRIWKCPLPKTSWSFWWREPWLLRSMATNRQTRAGIWLSGTSEWFRRRLALSEKGTPAFIIPMKHNMYDWSFLWQQNWFSQKREKKPSK